MDNKLNEFIVFKDGSNTSLLGDIRKIQGVTINDQYVTQIEELREIAVNDVKDVNNNILSANSFWAWFPWKNTLVRLVDDKRFQVIRTSRNKQLITEDEQRKFENLRVAIAGLSVGNSIANTIRMQGGAKKITLADYDVLSTSNMNRIRASIVDLGLSKIEIVRRQILEMDPFSVLKIFPEGIKRETIENFLSDVDLVFDEVDNLQIKILLRLEARKKGIPLIMLTDNDDGALIDYYPYHIHKETPLFYNVSDSEVMTFLEKVATKAEMVKISSSIVGRENISERMLHSLQEIGKTLYTWPQLGTAAQMCGVIGCYMARLISLGKNEINGRTLFRPDILLKWN